MGDGGWLFSQAHDRPDKFFMFSWRVSSHDTVVQHHAMLVIGRLLAWGGEISNTREAIYEMAHAVCPTRIAYQVFVASSSIWPMDGHMGPRRVSNRVYIYSCAPLVPPQRCCCCRTVCTVAGIPTSRRVHALFQWGGRNYETC